VSSTWPSSRTPATLSLRARHGEVGLIEWLTFAETVGQVIAGDADAARKHAIVAVVGLPGQAAARDVAARRGRHRPAALDRLSGTATALYRAASDRADC